MDDILKIQVATISLWNYVALIVNIIAFVILYMKANKNTSLWAFFRVQASMIIWLIGKILKTVSPTVTIRWAFIVFYYFGINLLSASFLDFAYIYYKGKPLNKVFRLLVYGISVFNFLLVFTNPYHFRFYSRYGFWGDDFGELFYLQLITNYILILLGMIFCIKKFRKQLHDKNKIERRLIGCAILLPLVFNLIYITRMLEAVFDYFEIQVFDVTPIVYTWSILVFVYATFRFEFFDLTPLMKHEITSRLRTPILITDENYQVLYSNKRLRQIFKNPEGVITKILHAERDVVWQGDKCYKCILNEVVKMGNAKYILTLNDVTSYQITNEMLIAENASLEDANKQLEEKIQLLKQTSYVGAKNYVGRELHDIVGHSLVVSMKLLEVFKISYKKNRETAIYNLENAKEVLLNGNKEIRTLREKGKDVSYSSDGLEKEITGMFKSIEINGIKKSFYVRGFCEKLDAKIFDVIKKISMELVTNTLKHAQATTLLLSIVFEKESVEIFYMDNGKGTEDIVKGNGLKGIDSRLELVSGETVYETSLGNGFSAKILIPLK